MKKLSEYPLLTSTKEWRLACWEFEIWYPEPEEWGEDRQVDFEWTISDGLRYHAKGTAKTEDEAENAISAWIDEHIDFDDYIHDCNNDEDDYDYE